MKRRWICNCLFPNCRAALGGDLTPLILPTSTIWRLDAYYRTTLKLKNHGLRSIAQPYICGRAVTTPDTEKDKDKEIS